MLRSEVDLAELAQNVRARCGSMIVLIGVACCTMHKSRTALAQ